MNTTDVMTGCLFEDGLQDGRPSGGRALYRHDVSGCLAFDGGAVGLRREDASAWLGRAGEVLDQLRRARLSPDEIQQDWISKAVALLSVADDEAVISEVQAAYDRLAVDAKTIIFFGTGGSSLGGQTLAQFGGWSIPGTTSAAQRERPATRFYDNLDPETLGGLLDNPDLGGLRFVVISKSGNTPETLSQAISTISALRDAGLGGRFPELLLGITEPADAGRKNGLRALFEEFDIPLLDHHTGIGGRFAVLTNVGLLPAVARGLDVVGIFRGARSVVSQLERSARQEDFPPAVGAALAVGLSKSAGVRMQVLMPYADRLGRLAHWYVQLWSESLGKGGEGTTPLACLGPLDQHSQLQLFMDGPREHLVTFLRVARSGVGPVIEPDLAKLAGFDEMAGRAVGDLVEAQTRGVPEALLNAGRPVRRIDLLAFDEVGLGALLMHFMIETILAGRILGLDPFDQPAVELAKRLTRERLD